jgi:hypothetical protein
MPIGYASIVFIHHLAPHSFLTAMLQLLLRMPETPWAYLRNVWCSLMRSC